jgi:hypothetical protein
MEENWKAIPGYEGLYEASDLGRVRSLDRVVFTQSGISRRIKGKLLKPITCKDDLRQQVSLCKDYCVTVIRLHHVIMLTFVGNRPEGLVTCHYDGNPSNNALSNLRYDTASSNMKDAVRHGTANLGERCPSAKLTAEQVLEIRCRLEMGEKVAIISQSFGISHQQISKIKNRTRWQHI